MSQEGVRRMRELHANNIALVQNLVAGALAKAISEFGREESFEDRAGFLIERADAAIAQAMDAIALSSEPMICGPDKRKMLADFPVGKFVDVPEEMK